MNGHELEQRTGRQFLIPSLEERQHEQTILLCNCEAEMEEVSGHGRENTKPEDNFFETTTLPGNKRLAATVLMFVPRSSTDVLLHAVSRRLSPVQHRRASVKERDI